MKAILHRALARRETKSDAGLSHDELIETAAELGIDRKDLEQAIAEESKERSLADARQDWIATHKAQLRTAAITYAFVNAVCFAVDWMTPGGPWFQWVLLGTLIAFLMNVVGVVRGPSPLQVERHEARRQRRLRRQARRERFERGAQLLSDVVETGFGLLVEHLDQHRQQRRSLRRPPDPPSLPGSDRRKPGP
jgi:hypothetical protein